MKMQIECTVCFMEQAARAARLSCADRQTQLKALREAARLIASLDESRTPPETATDIFRAVADITGNPDGFRELKAASNNAVKKLTGELSLLISESSDPLETAVKVSLCGNIIDYGIFDDYDLDSLIREETRKPADRKGVEKIREAAKGSGKIAFLADNAGEIGLDALLLDELKKLNPDLEITVLVKSAPIINDATREDAEFFGIDKRYPVYETPATVGVRVPDLTGRGSAAVKEADWIIAKGQANYELLSETSLSRVIYLLRAKCGVVARDTGVKVNTPLIIVKE